MPVTLEQPGEGGPIQVYAGDPLEIRLKIRDEDRTNHSFIADVRRRPQEPQILMSFDVSTFMDGDDTVVMLGLTGDSFYGAQDGQTRKIGSRASFDVQEFDEFEIPVQTLAVGQLKAIEDVTR